jgi:hypothetical protein
LQGVTLSADGCASGVKYLDADHSEFLSFFDHFPAPDGHGQLLKQ